MTFLADILLGILKKYWYIGVIILLAALLANSCSNSNKLRNKLSSSSGEKQALLLDVSRLTQEVTLLDDDFNMLLSDKKELQWVLDSLNKNPKVITEIHYIKTTKELRDTVRINTEEYNGLMLNRASYETCGLKVDFMWFNMDTLGDFSIKKSNELAIVTTNERKRLFDWKRTPKWGKRQYELTVLNQCGDSIITNYKITKEQ